MVNTCGQECQIITGRIFDLILSVHGHLTPYVETGLWCAMRLLRGKE